ncbi:MAG: hypothetical protein R2826_00825 [Thermoleophilia bacterium]
MLHRALSSLLAAIVVFVAASILFGVAAVQFRGLDGPSPRS